MRCGAPTASRRASVRRVRRRRRPRLDAGAALGAAHSARAPSIRRPSTATDPKRHVICAPNASRYTRPTPPGRRPPARRRHRTRRARTPATGDAPRRRPGGGGGRQRVQSRQRRHRRDASGSRVFPERTQRAVSSDDASERRASSERASSERASRALASSTTRTVVPAPVPKKLPLASGSGAVHADASPRRGRRRGHLRPRRSASVARAATGPDRPEATRRARSDGNARSGNRLEKNAHVRAALRRERPRGDARRRRASARRDGGRPGGGPPEGGARARPRLDVRRERARPAGAGGRSHARRTRGGHGGAPVPRGRGLPEEAFFSPSPASASAAATRRNEQNAGVDANPRPRRISASLPTAGPSTEQQILPTGTGAFASRGDVSSAETAAARGSRRSPRRGSRGRRLAPSRRIFFVLRTVRDHRQPGDPVVPDVVQNAVSPPIKFSRHSPPARRRPRPASRAGVSHAPSADETNRSRRSRAGRGLKHARVRDGRSPCDPHDLAPRRVDRSRRDARGTRRSPRTRKSARRAERRRRAGAAAAANADADPHEPARVVRERRGATRSISVPCSFIDTGATTRGPNWTPARP